MLYFHKDKMNKLIASPAFLQILLILIAIFVTYLITLIVKKIINRTIKQSRFGHKIQYLNKHYLRKYLKYKSMQHIEAI